MFRNARLTMNPLYHCLICLFVKFVLFNRKSKSSLDSFLFFDELPPI